MPGAYDAIVIGGGIQGCATALFLAKQGRRVAVLEKDYVARHASGVNSGGVRTLGRDLRELPLAIEARRYWEHMPEWVGDDCGFRVVGNVRVAENERDMAKLVQRSADVRALGLDYEERVIDRAELRRLVPALAPHCVGAISVPRDGYADPYRTTRAFGRAAAAAGAHVRESCEVVDATYRGGAWRVASAGGELRARNIVNCAGAWGARVARMLGDEIPLAPNGSMQFITERMPRFVDPVVGSATRAFSLKQLQNGTVLFGGGHRAPVSTETNACDVACAGIGSAARTAVELFPLLRDAQIVRAWSGIEGFTGDRLPVIGRGSAEGVIHAFGFSGHGFQLGPAVGALVCELLVEGSTRMSIEPFSPARLQTTTRSLHAA